MNVYFRNKIIDKSHLLFKFRQKLKNLQLQINLKGIKESLNIRNQDHYLTQNYQQQVKDLR